VQHWKGEFPIGVSYWANAILVMAMLAILSGALDVFDITRASRTLTFCLVVLALLLLPLSVWQFVGMWRSANLRASERDGKGRTDTVAWLTKGAISLICLALLDNTIVYCIPNCWANLKVAFGQDLTSRHMLSVRNGGTEIEIAGGIDVGTAADLRALLNASSSVRTIDFDNLGGPVSEALNVRTMIQEKHLATYTEGYCASACAVAYLGGFPRFLGPNGRLGFHRYAIPGLTEAQDSEANRTGEQDLVKAGISPAFARQAFATPSNQTWMPDANVLVSSHVVTQMVDGLAFASPSTGLTSENVARMIGHVASFAALRRAEPAVYAQAVDSILKGIQQGRSKQDALDQAHGLLLGVVAKYRPQAADDVQVQIAATIAEEARILAAARPDVCASLFTGQAGADYLQYLPSDVRNREVAVSAAVIEASATPPHSVADGKTASAQIAHLWARVKRNGFDTSAADKSAASCLAMSAFMRDVSKMPSQQAGPLMRYLSKS
jgi:hypothetical protein